MRPPARLSRYCALPLAIGLFAAGLAAPAAVSSATAGPRSAEAIFASRCAYCHDAGGWGTRALARRLPAGEPAVLLERANLPPPYTVAVVRRGLGAMPQFTPAELTDAELAALAQWLEDRR